MFNDKILFINVDPKVLYDKFFHHGSTKVILAEHTIDISQIVFEITEKTAITDLANFILAIHHYVKKFNLLYSDLYTMHTITERAFINGHRK